MAERAQSINDGVACHHDLLSRNPFEEKFVARERRRSKVNSGEDGDQPSVCLFGERIVNIVAAQTRFNMTDRDLAIIGGKRRRESGCRVPLHQNHIRLKTSASILYRVEHSSGEGIQGLVGAHHIQIKIGFDLEKLERMIKHRPVLARVNYGGLELVGTTPQFMNDKSEFDCLRPGAENGYNATFHNAPAT